jgi:hypothetical protein
MIDDGNSPAAAYTNVQTSEVHDTGLGQFPRPGSYKLT